MDNVVPGTFTDNYTSRNRVTRPPMYTHGGSSFPRAVTLFGQGRRVSYASFQSLVPRSGSLFHVPTYRFITQVYVLLISCLVKSTNLKKEKMKLGK